MTNEKTIYVLDSSRKYEIPLFHGQKYNIAFKYNRGCIIGHRNSKGTQRAYQGLAWALSSAVNLTVRRSQARLASVFPPCIAECYDHPNSGAPSVHDCVGMVTAKSAHPSALRALAASPLTRRPQLQPLHRLTVSSQPCTLQYHTATFGSKTPSPENVESPLYKTVFRFETGYALRPKRPSRPFPPPFVSIPSSSFSDPLTTHSKSQDRRPKVGGELIRGLTNGDDAILAADNFLGVNDGVGAWATKPQGHAA